MSLKDLKNKISEEQKKESSLIDHAKKLSSARIKNLFYNLTEF